MSYAQEMLDRIERQQRMGGKDRLVVGKHRLAVLSFGRVDNKRGVGGRLQASFEVVQSTIYQPGAHASIAFFVETAKFPEYEFDRANQFIAACAACTGDVRGVAAYGGEMMGAANAARGVVIDVTVTADLREDGSPKKGPKGNQYTTETWEPIAGQTKEQVAQARVELDRRHPPGAQSGLAPAAPATQSAASQPATPAAPATQPAAAAAGWGTPTPGSSLLGRK